MLLETQNLPVQARMYVLSEFVERGHGLGVRVKLFHLKSDGIDCGGTVSRI